MAEDGRPAKLQRLENTADTSDAKLVQPTASNGEPENIAPSHVKEKTVEIESAEGDASAAQTEHTVPPISKNQLKKLRKEQKWEAGREERKEKRKEKAKAKKERKREEFRQKKEAGANGESSNAPQDSASQGKVEPTQLPVTIMFDCNFDEFMHIPEIKSLGTQITRCYSDNRQAPFRAHLAVASFGGRLKDRYDNVLSKQYKSWQNFRFFDEDFVAVAEKAKEWMKGDKGGKIAGALVQNGDSTSSDQEEGEVVYLSSESDVTLERLKPYSTYIIGGLVDKNRHKGICYRRAQAAGIKTARLPIGEFLKMNSRQVLATNHVLEIMLKWLESGDWGDAFMQVMPKRKGGTLRSSTEERHDEEEQEEQTEADLKAAGKEANTEQKNAGAEVEPQKLDAESGGQEEDAEDGGVKVGADSEGQKPLTDTGNMSLEADTGDAKNGAIAGESSGAGAATEESSETVTSQAAK